MSGGGGRVSGNFFKTLVQAVLMFGEETWVLTPRMERDLESFQHGATRRITGRQPQRREGRAMDEYSSEGGHERSRVRVDSEGHHEEAE